jgi:hypothetical protein
VAPLASAALSALLLVSACQAGTVAVATTHPTGATSTPEAASPAPSSTAASGTPSSPSSSSSAPATSTGSASSSRGTALAALSALAVKGRAPKTGYDRDLFGQAWADVDRNGCDTRNDVLRRDLSAFVLKAGTHGCLVLSGTLHDPYTGRTIGFVRGQQTSIAVQIDHVVALSDAWQKGAQQWSADTRERFANDPLNLLAVDGPTNSRKSDGDAATWLPPAKAYRCRYVARQVAVKRAYGLWVTSAEKVAIARVLSSCPDQGLPKAGAFILGGGPERAASSPSPSPTKARTTTKPGSADVYYANCTAVRAAGAAPIHRGDPGYARHLDRDGDGVGCE